MMLYIVIFSILSPSVLFKGITINLLDFLPLFFLINVIITKNTKININPAEELFFRYIVILLLLWSFSTLLAVFINHEPESSVMSILQFYRRFVALLIVPLYVVYLNGNFNLNNIIKQLSIYSICIGFFGILINFSPVFRELYMAYISNSGQTFSGLLYRNMGFIGEPNYFATLLSLIVLANIYIATYRNKAIYIILLFIVLITTFSKSVLASLIIVLLLMSTNKKNFPKVLLIIIMSILLIVMMYYSNPYFSNYFGRDALDSLNNRIDFIWEHAIDIYSSNELNYFFGLGAKGLKSYYNVEGVHNNFLAFLIDFGLMGGGLSIILLVFLIPYSVTHKSKFLIATTLLCIIESFVHEPYYHSSILAMLFFFYALLLEHNRLLIRI
jgi:hypothetical protein